jgi:FKBP-type peptidyl-prolyl cis-trans isomerase
MNNALRSWLAVLLLLPGAAARAQPPAPEASAGTAGAADAAAGSAPWIEEKGGLRHRDLAVGDGAEARPGRMLQVHYTGWLATGGEPFDTSRTSGRAFAFVLGSGQVIRGWDKGLVGMRVGGKRELLIPAKLGYGSRGVPERIPPGADLRFEIELLAVSGAPR